MVLNRGGASTRGESRKFQGGANLYMFYNMKVFFNENVSLPNVTPVLILRCYMLFGLGPALGLSFFKFAGHIETAYKHSGAQLGRLFSQHAVPSHFDNNICDVLAFESSIVQIDFQGSQLHRRGDRLIPDKYECIQFAQLHAAWETAMAFCDSTSFLQGGRTPA